MNYCIKPISDVWDKAKDRYFKRGMSNNGIPMVWEKMRWKCRPQELTIWSGYPGHGKSAFLSMMALQLALHGEKTVIASFEMPIDQTAARMMKQATGSSHCTDQELDQAKSWMEDHIYFYDYVGRVSDQGSMIDQFIIASQTLGVTQFQVDSLLKCGMNEDDYNGQKRLLEDLHNFAMQYHAHVHIVAHSRKSENEYGVPGKMDVAHSGSIAQLCNNGMTIWRNKKKEENKEAGNTYIPTDYDAIMWCWKSRECGPDEEGRYGFYYNHSAIQYLERLDSQPMSLYPDVSLPF